MPRPTRIIPFIRREDGASMVEYGVALLVVTAVGTGALMALGSETSVSVAAACQSINDDVAC
jgi:Flp pilus assembly pilin Flp